MDKFVTLKRRKIDFTIVFYQKDSELKIGSITNLKCLLTYKPLSENKVVHSLVRNVTMHLC
jgi:hypothetical protein